MRFEDCRSEAWARLTERPPPYLESAYNNRKVSERSKWSYKGEESKVLYAAWVYILTRNTYFPRS